MAKIASVFVLLGSLVHPAFSAPATSAGGIAIPLHRRGPSAAGAEGKNDIAAIVRAVSQTVKCALPLLAAILSACLTPSSDFRGDSKVQNRLRTLEANGEALPAGAKIFDYTLGLDGVRVPGDLKKRGGVPVKHQAACGDDSDFKCDEVLWAGQITVGTPPRTFVTEFDTSLSSISLSGSG